MPCVALQTRTKLLIPNWACPEVGPERMKLLIEVDCIEPLKVLEKLPVFMVDAEGRRREMRNFLSAAKADFISSVLQRHKSYRLGNGRIKSSYRVHSCQVWGDRLLKAFDLIRH